MQVDGPGGEPASEAGAARAEGAQSAGGVCPGQARTGLGAGLRSLIGAHRFRLLLKEQKQPRRKALTFPRDRGASPRHRACHRHPNVPAPLSLWLTNGRAHHIPGHRKEIRDRAGSRGPFSGSCNNCQEFRPSPQGHRPQLGTGSGSHGKPEDMRVELPAPKAGHQERGREGGVPTTACGSRLPQVCAPQGGLGTEQWGPTQRQARKHSNACCPGVLEVAW